MSRYDLFRDRTKTETGLAASNVADFIKNSLSSTHIKHIRWDKKISAVLTRDHKEGNDEIILFTYPCKDDSQYNLRPGDYIKHNTKHYLVFMEYDHPLRDHYLKFKILECNVIVKFDNFSQDGAYFGGLRRFTDTQVKTFSPLVAQFENTKPIIVTADSSEIKINTRFLAANESYRVINLDRISNQGLIYLSLEPTPYSPTTDIKVEGKAVTPPKASVTADPAALRKGEQKVIPIIGGFVSFDPTVKVVRRTMTTVTFNVPFDINNLEITTKDTNGDLVSTTYEVI